MKGLPNYRKYPMGDVVNANLEPGEYVVRRSAVNSIGTENMELLNHADGAHGALNKLMVSASLVHLQPQDNSPVKIEANGFPIADSPVRQRVDATRNMQEGGEVERRRLPMLSGLWGERSNIVEDEKGKKIQMIYSIPAGQLGEGGAGQYRNAEEMLADQYNKRYYLGESPFFKNEEGVDKHHFKDYVRMMGERYASHDARGKMAYSPADSIPQAMVENYFDQFRQEEAPVEIPKKKSRLRSLLGMQNGGEVGEGMSVRDYLGSLQENYQKYQGDVMTEAGDLKFNPSGQFTREGLAEEYNFPLEEAKFDTLYGYGTPGARDAAINITLPNNRLIEHTSHMNTDKYGEFEENERKIQDQMKKEHSRALTDLGTMMGGDYSEAIEAEEAGYLNMGPYEQHEYAMGKSRKKIEEHQRREEEKKKEREASPEYRKKMMEALGMKSDEEYDAFLEFKRRLGGGMQEGGKVPSGNWGPKGAYNEALQKAREEEIGSKNLKSLGVLEMLRLINASTGEQPERLEQLNPERQIKIRESIFNRPDSNEYNMPTFQGDSGTSRTPVMKAPSDNYGGNQIEKNLDVLIPYLQSYGRIKTPLQQKNEFLYNRLGVNPEQPPPSLQGLQGSALLQRLGSEGI